MAYERQITQEAERVFVDNGDVFDTPFSWIFALVKPEAPANKGLGNVFGIMPFPSVWVSACGVVGRYHYHTMDPNPCWLLAAEVLHAERCCCC